MPKSNKKPSPITRDLDKSSSSLNNNASSTSYTLPNSPSLQNEEGFRHRSPRKFGKSNNNNNDDDDNDDDLSTTTSQSITSSTTFSNEDVKSPYVNFHNKLTLAWVTYPIIPLFFIILRTVNVMNSIQPLVDQIKNKILLSCNALESSTSTLANLPNLMITEFNKINANSIDSIISKLLGGLDLLVFGLEQICVWLIITFKSTYRCLLQLAINSSLSFQTESLAKLHDFVTTTVNTIRTNVNNEVQNYNQLVNNLKSSVPLVNLPTLQINSLSQLDNLQQFPASNILIPGVDLLTTNSNNSLTFTFDGIESELINITTIPFELLRTDIKNTAANIHFNQSLLPQASLFANQDITFCKDNLDLSILDRIASDLIKISYVGIALVVLIIIILILINVAIIRYNHKRSELNISRVSNHLSSSYNSNNNGGTNGNKIDQSVVLEVIGLIKNPFLTRFTLRFSKFFKSLENRNLLKWFLHYISHKPAIICLIIGISGILTIYLQLAILTGVKNNYKSQITTAVDQFSANVVGLINSNLESKSKQFSNQSNTEIINVENVLNNNLFTWSNTTITTLNNTLNTAVDDVTGFINNLFKDVPLIGNIVLDLLNCIILVKVRGIQKGLTFIKDNSFINLPRVNDTILMVNSDNIKSIVDKDSSKFLGGDNADNNDGINKLFNIYEQSLLSELTIHWTFIAIYLVVIIMGIGHVIYYKYRNKKIREKQFVNDIKSKYFFKDKDDDNIINEKTGSTDLDNKSDNSKNNLAGKRKPPPPPILPPKPLLVKR